MPNDLSKNNPNQEIKYLDLYAQYQSIQSEIDTAIAQVIKESAFIGGRFVKQFEQDFAKYIDLPFCIGVGNGTDALEIAIEALDLPPHSDIIVPALTFAATSEAVTRAGQHVIFADIDPNTFTISPESLEKRITDKTKAVIAVHLYGHPCDMQRINTIAQKYDLKVIEDCAQAHGATIDHKHVGHFSDLATFSFFPGKILGAFGDAGAIVTKNEIWAHKCAQTKDHGRTHKAIHQFEGRNSRLDGLQAAILSVKLKHLDSWVNHRRKVAQYYKEELQNCPSIELPKEHELIKHAYHLFVIKTSQRDALKKHLDLQGIPTGIHYPLALTQQEAYKALQQSEWTPEANQCAQKVLSLPMGEHLNRDNIKTICQHIKLFY